MENIPAKKTLKILYFFPHNIIPPRSGAHIRGLEIVKSLLKFECTVFFCSSTFSSETEWTDSAGKDLEKLGIAGVYLYRGTIFDKAIRWMLRRIYSIFHKEPPVDSFIYSPPAMRRWFRTIQEKLEPDVIWMNYSRWDPLIDRTEKNGPYLIIDYLDLISRNCNMQKELMNCFEKQDSVWIPLGERILQESFFSGHDYPIDQTEMRILVSYDLVTAISRTDADLIRKHDSGVPIRYLPVMHEAVFCENLYDSSAIFVTGPNGFNLQGYYYFIVKILPIILHDAPDFNLWVTGSCSDKVRPAQSVSLVGYVDDLTKYYCSARFAVCPVLGGTGQQIKIVEAMAHGLPVVATKYSGSTSPIVHGCNGFIADNAEEFAIYCIKLWQNPGLCKKMGSAARRTIIENFSEKCLTEKLSEILDLPVRNRADQ